jgi:oligo-1,6-glucosidase
MLGRKKNYNGRQWWKEAIFYQVYPRSFRDTNGDGNGDLAGIIEKLDYLHDLGVGAVWLAPVYASPMADNGYDVSDYYTINPMFGTMADFEKLLAGLHSRGMKLMMDLVINHTSVQHPWFLESRSSLDNPKRDWYIWRYGRDGREPNNWACHFMTSAWEFDQKTGQYYLHMFSKEQADLNWRNAEMKEEIFRMMRFWLGKGVDAFRMDMANYLMKAESLPDAPRREGDARPYVHGEGLYANQPGMHELITEIRSEVLDHFGAILFGEMYFLTPETALEYAAYDKHEMAMLYQYEIVGAAGDWEKTKRSVRVWHEAFKDKAWNSIAFSNHDSPRPVSIFGEERNARTESAKCLATYLMTAPGTPFFLEGEELGMTNVTYPGLDDYSDIAMKTRYAERVSRGEDPAWVFADLARWSRDNARTPMQWNAEAEAGFTTGKSWLGVNLNYPEVNVASEEADTESVLNFYKKLIALRKKTPALVYGEYVPLTPDDWETYAYKRVLKDKTYVIILNTSPRQWRMKILDELKNGKPELLLSNLTPADDTEEEFFLRPWEARIYKLS